MFGHFYQNLNDAIQYNKSGSLLAVCLIDLDDFSAVNREYSEAIGDQLLRVIELRLQQFMHDQDFMARSNSDQFYLCFELRKNRPQLFQQLLEHIQQPVRIDTHLIALNASIGVSLNTGEKNSADRLIRNAMQACIEVKNSHGGQYKIFDEEGVNIIKRHRQWTDEVMCGLSRGEFELYLQPKLDIATRLPYSFEALIRWRHPQRGFIPPVEFLPRIADTEADVLLGQWVLEQSVLLLESFRKQGLSQGLSINISPKQLTNTWFARQLHQLAIEKPAIMANLCLEILESESFSNLELVHDYLARYQSYGIQLALDDFGTGFASLTHLIQLPLNEVKIDRNFIQAIDQNPINQVVVRHIIELASELQLLTIAEGVETEAEFETLAKLGVHRVQGFLFATPFPSNQIRHYLSSCETLEH